jgi:hypothetical protein
MGEFSERIHVKVTPEMDSDVARMSEDTDIEEPRLVRILLEHALKYPPEWIAQLRAMKRRLEEAGVS